MPKTDLPFADGFYRTQSLPFSSQRCVNMTPHAAENSAYAQVGLFAVSGVTELVADGVLDGVCRGMTIMAGVLYSVNGNQLYSWDSLYVPTAIGSILGTGRVQMANNNNKLCIVNTTGEGFVYDSDTTTLTQITDPAYQLSASVVFKDGYYVFSALDGRTFFNSAINDPLTFDALDFGTAEINPDLITGLVVNRNQLFAVGTDTIEIFSNIGGTGFPFQRVDGGLIEKGSSSLNSMVQFEQDWVFIGSGYNERDSIWLVSGTRIASISTDAIDHEIQKFTRDEIKANSYAVSYSENGQKFVAFTFESDADRIPSKTFVYNINASAKAGKPIWFERQTGLTQNKWRVSHIQHAYNRLVVGDTEDGRMGYLDTTTQLEYNTVMLNEFSTSPLHGLNQRVFFGDVELTCEAGVGLVAGQGSDPTIEMTFSDDGGRTYNNIMARSLGKIGEYNSRTIWRRQGRAPINRCYKFRVSDPVNVNVLQFTAYMTVGTQ